MESLPQTGTNNGTSTPRQKTDWLLMLAILVVIALLLVRFVHLAADPPTWISGSGDLYTDEGWWAANAAAQVLSGHWYHPGGYNPAVVAPVMPLLEYGVFRGFGFGLITARAVSLACGFFAVLFISLLAARWAGYRTGLICALLLVGNYLIFIFSRLAFLELPLTFGICLSLWLASRAVDSSSPRNGYLLAALSGAALLLAMLTKTTALFALPVLIWVLWQSGASSSHRARLLRPILCLAVLLVLGGTYAGVILHQYPADVRIFVKYNLANKLPAGLRQLPAMAPRARALHAVNNHPLFYLAWVMLALGLILLIKIPGFRRSRLYTAAMLWMGCYLAAISPGGYYPTRYFVHLAFPAAALCAVWLESMPRREWAVGLLAVILLPQCVLIVRDLAHPRYSLVSMANDINSRARGTRRFLFGDPANTVGLLTGLPAEGESLGILPPAVRLAGARPDYYLSIGPIPEILRREYSTVARLHMIATYPVLNDYVTGQDVYLYRVETGYEQGIRMPNVESGKLINQKYTKKSSD